MNYELAKKLKDAGWPQHKFDKHGRPPIRVSEVFGKMGTTTYFEEYVVPTLDELIEACGEGFDMLNHGDKWAITDAEANNPNREFEWKAIGGVIPSNRLPLVGKGKTPSEAVANLWLKLNKK